MKYLSRIKSFNRKSIVNNLKLYKIGIIGGIIGGLIGININTKLICKCDKGNTN
jgi:hypothetical protein